jgi:hypothetical protein
VAAATMRSRTASWRARVRAVSLYGMEEVNQDSAFHAS